VLVGNDFPPDVGGIQHYVAALAERLPDVAVVAGAHRDADDAALDYPVRRGSRRFLWPTGSTKRLVQRAVSQHDARVVVFTAPFPLPPLGDDLGVPFTVVCHGAELVLPTAIPVVARRYRRWLRQAACLFTVSRYTAGHLRTLVGPDGPPIRFARPGVDLGHHRPVGHTARQAVRAQYGVGRHPLIVSVGRLVPRKGTGVLIAALPRVRESVPGARLVVAGDGRRRGRLERLAERGEPGGVIFAGRVPVARLPALCSAADVAAMPVRTRWRGLEQEGFGMVFVEAQACGTPVVAGRSGGAPETVVDGETGFVVDGSDPDAVAAALIAVLTDPDRKAAMGRAARSHVTRHFDWDVVAAGLHADLTAIASGSPVRSEA
jgi:phosphatidylinositol alpha-1,6-mannosyltransferase